MENLRSTSLYGHRPPWKSTLWTLSREIKLVYSKSIQQDKMSTSSKNSIYYWGEACYTEDWQYSDDVNIHDDYIDENYDYDDKDL